MKRKLIYILFSCSIILNFILIYKFFIQGENVVFTEDKRVEIRMSKENRAFVMNEMRGFLESIQQINEGITKNNPDIILKVSAKSGSGKVHEVPKGLVRSLPFEFKQMGFQTHELFDEISKISKENYNREQIQQKLNQQLNNCISCHKTYQITAQ